MPKIAVIGGGWSGLATAVQLVENGLQVCLFEAGKTLGGRAKTTYLDGRELDNGQHILLGAYSETLGLIRRIDVDPADIFLRLSLRFRGDEGFSLCLPNLPSPLNLGVGLMLAKGVGLREKIRAARWIQALKTNGFLLAGDISVAHWLNGAGQTGQLRRFLWEPLCLAALNTPCDRASAQIFANILRDSLGSPNRASTDLLIPRVPLGAVLPEPALQWLSRQGAEIRFSHRVQSIENCCVDGEVFDAVVVAVAPQHSAKLLPFSPPMDYEPIATVYLEYPNILGDDNNPLMSLQTALGSVWVIQRESLIENKTIFSGVISGSGPWELKTDLELVQEIHRAFLHQMRLSSLGAKPVWSRVVREKRATFSCRPHLSRPPIKTVIPSVWRVGDYTWSEYPATLEGAVRSGIHAAKQIITTFKQR